MAAEFGFARFVAFSAQLSVMSFRVTVAALWVAITIALIFVNGTAADAIVPFVLVWFATAISASFCVSSSVWQQAQPISRALMLAAVILTLVNACAILLAFLLEDHKSGGFFTALGSITFIAAFFLAPIAVGSAIAIRIMMRG